MKKNDAFYNKDCAGFHLYMDERFKKLKKSTLILAPGILNYIMARNLSNQNTYIGSISCFIEDIPSTEIIPAVRDLIKSKIIQKNSDDSIEISSTFSTFLINHQKRVESKSKDFELAEAEEFRDLYQMGEKVGDFNAILNFISEQKKKNVYPYNSYFKGIYSHYIKVFLEMGHKIEHVENLLKVYLLDIYFTKSNDKNKKTADSLYRSSLKKFLKENGVER